MNQTLEQLIKLQEIDQRLLEIKDFMGDLPLTVENQEKVVSSLELENRLKQDEIASPKFIGLDFFELFEVEVLIVVEV